MRPAVCQAQWDTKKNSSVFSHLCIYYSFHNSDSAPAGSQALWAWRCLGSLGPAQCGRWTSAPAVDMSGLCEGTFRVTRRRGSRPWPESWRMDRGKGARGKTKFGCEVGECIGRSIGIYEARREKRRRFFKKHWRSFMWPDARIVIMSHGQTSVCPGENPRWAECPCPSYQPFCNSLSFSVKWMWRK